MHFLSSPLTTRNVWEPWWNRPICHLVLFLCILNVQLSWNNTFYVHGSKFYSRQWWMCFQAVDILSSFWKIDSTHDMPLNSIYSVILWIKSSKCLTQLWCLVCLKNDVSTWVTAEGYHRELEQLGRMEIPSLLFKWKMGAMGALGFFRLETKNSFKSH